MVRFLPEDVNVAHPAAVGLHELLRLHKHTAGAAARVVDAALVRRQHFDQELHDAPRRVELAALLALRAGELGEEVLVDATQDVLRAVGLVAQADVADHVDELAEALLVEPRVGVILGQHALERGVVALHGKHGVVHRLADGGQLRARQQERPTGLFGHPESIDGPILIRVFRVGALSAFCFQPAVLLFEGIRDVFEEDQPEDDVLVLGCVHVAAQRVGRFPELVFETEVRGGVAVLVCHSCGVTFRFVSAMILAHRPILCQTCPPADAAHKSSVRYHGFPLSLVQISRWPGRPRATRQPRAGAPSTGPLAEKDHERHWRSERMPSDIEFLRQRLVLVQRELARPNANQQQARRPVRQSDLVRLHIAYQREARLLQKLLNRAHPGNVLPALIAWRQTLSQFAKEHRTVHGEVIRAYDEWPELPRAVRARSAAPPEPPAPRFIDHDGAPWMADDGLLRVVDDVIERLQKWLDEETGVDMIGEFLRIPARGLVRTIEGLLSPPIPAILTIRSSEYQHVRKEPPMQTFTLHVAQRGLVTLPQELRKTHNIQPGQEMTLLDLDGVFVLSQQPSQVDALADRIADDLGGRGETLASMLQTLCEVRAEHA